MAFTLLEYYKARRASSSIQTPAIALESARNDLARGRELFSLRKPSRPSHGDVLRTRGPDGSKMTFVIAVVDDDDSEAPWKREDGHGPVTDWTSRDKRPGELELNSNHGQKRFYDFQAACKTAREDGWNTKPYDTVETSRQRAARAAMADYERLREWCNDDWRYVGVCLFLLPRDETNDPAAIANNPPFGDFPHAGLWGIESDATDYIADVAVELLSEARDL
jgi:hypothetical protein